MAQIQHVFMDSITGKFNNVVFYRRNGKVFIRSLPVRKDQEPSRVQQYCRQRFGDVMAFYQVVKSTPLIRVWRVAAGEGPANSSCLFLKYNLPAFDGSGGVTDYACLHFSVGQLPGMYRLTGRWLQEKGEVHLSWENDPCMEPGREEDRLMAVVVYENDEFTVFMPKETKAGRGDKKVILQLPPAMPVPCAVYCFFTDKRHRLYSNDCYCKL